MKNIPINLRNLATQATFKVNSVNYYDRATNLTPSINFNKSILPNNIIVNEDDHFVVSSDSNMFTDPGTYICSEINDNGQILLEFFSY